MSNDTETIETAEDEEVQEIFATEKDNDESTLVQETLQIISAAENKQQTFQLIPTAENKEQTLQIISAPDNQAQTLQIISAPENKGGTLQIISASENIGHVATTSDGISGAVEGSGDEVTPVYNNEETVDKNLDGKQVLIVAAQNSEENIINLPNDGKQFLILASPDANALNVGSLEELKTEESGEPAAKRYKIQGQDGQSYVLTVAAEGQGGSVLETDLKKSITSGVNKGVEKKSQLLQSDVSQAWFTSRDDKNMLQSSGASWRQGQWTKDEVDLLQINISDYCKQHGISDPTEIIFEMSKDERKQFYRTVARGLQRPLFSVYRRVIRMYDQKNHIGKYSPEEMVKLRELKSKHGKDWALIGQALGRSASSVKDKCRLMKDTCNSGKWLPDEEQRLTDAVYEFSGSQPGENVVQGLSWSLVAEKVITRSEKQCRTKWLNYLNWKQKGGTDWTREDDMNLILRVVNLGVANDTEIDWNELAKDWKSVRSPQWLRGKWWSLKRHIPDYQLLPYNQLLEYMKTFFLNCRVRPVTGSRAMKTEPPTDQMAYIPITLTGLQMDSVLEEGVPAVQAYEVLQQLPETTGSFVITQPQDNSSAIQSGFSEHIIVQTVPVSQPVFAYMQSNQSLAQIYASSFTDIADYQQTGDDDVQVQSNIVITSPSTSDTLNGAVDLSQTITLAQEHSLHEFIKENVISQTDSLSADHSTFDTATLVEQDISESNDVMSIKSEPEASVLLTPTYVTPGSSDADLMTSFTDPMLNSDSNSMMETASDMDSDKNSDMIVNIG